MQSRLRTLMLCGVVVWAGCAAPNPEGVVGEEPAAKERPAADSAEEVRQDWAIVVHGGAGTPPRDMSDERRQGYEQALLGAVAAGEEHLAAGGTAVDAVELMVVLLEDDERFNAGKGAVFTHDAVHELDAAVMDGSDRSCGAVAGVKTVRNPIRLARLVMDRSPHVFLIGEGAEQFATEMEVERVENSWFDTEGRRKSLERALASEKEEKHGTVGAVALDTHGNLAAATSTGGLTNKRFGRVGDVPVIGAGTYADNACCGISGTGKGEQFIRHTVARSIAARVQFEGLSIDEAARRVFAEHLDDGDGGVIMIDRAGRIGMHYNTGGMYRAWADASGTRGVAIWEQE